MEKQYVCFEDEQKLDKMVYLFLSSKSEVSQKRDEQKNCTSSFLIHLV